MPVEVDCYTLKRAEDDELSRSFVVNPGSSENIVFLKKAKIVVFCDVDDTRATVYVLANSLEKQVEAWISESEDDENGQRVSINRPIKVRGEQILAVTLRRDTKKEVNIYHR